MSSRILTPPDASDGYPAPIFLFLALLLVSVLVAALNPLSSSAVVPVVSAAAILAALALHLALHWLSPRWSERERVWILYSLAQAGLAGVLVLFTANASVWALTFVWLVGEMLGLVEQPRQVVLTLLVYGAIAVSVLFVAVGASTAMQWLGATLPTAIVVGLLVVLYRQQVEARLKAQRLILELEEANRQISAYAERVEELTLANERQRMARELHDTLAQDVAGIVLQLEATTAYMEAGRTEKAQAIIRHAMARARAALKDARAAIDNLRDYDTRLRLSKRLQALCERFEGESDLPCGLVIKEGPWDSALSEAQKEQVERVVSEALANVAKHASATRVMVAAESRGNSLFVTITDNGAGFDVSRVPGRDHYGLRGMRERARLLGGTLRIESVLNHGTSVVLEFALDMLLAQEHTS